MGCVVFALLAFGDARACTAGRVGSGKHPQTPHSWMISSPSIGAHCLMVLRALGGSEHTSLMMTRKTSKATRLKRAGHPTRPCRGCRTHGQQATMTNLRCEVACLLLVRQRACGAGTYASLLSAAIDLPMSKLSMKGAKGDLMERVGVHFQWVCHL